MAIRNWQFNWRDNMIKHSISRYLYTISYLADYYYWFRAQRTERYWYSTAYRGGDYIPMYLNHVIKYL